MIRCLYNLGLWCVAVACGVLLFLSSPVSAAGQKDMLQGDHGNRSLMPKSCRACHRGMSMAISGEESTCLNCHGDSFQRGQMLRQRFLLNDPGLADIGAELAKPYAHPVLKTQGVHQSLEKLPEDRVNAARHSECVDCHDPHLASKDVPYRGIPGRKVGNFMADVEQEYELCYKCHSDSANLPLGSTNKHDEFKSTNRSFHPVEAEGRNQYVISLRSPYVGKKERPGDVSMISCSSCHGSDDPSGPAGPHGSNFPGLLKANYETGGEQGESHHAYALCYGCHDRNSILGNESFAFHSLHIEGEASRGMTGTSCFTCHDAHGSSQYQYLIRFNEDVVRPNADGRLEFKAQGVASRHGSCLLNCHGVEHNPKSY